MTLIRVFIQKKIINIKPVYNSEPKIDSYNPTYIKQGGDVQVRTFEFL